jgi:hypothetical protein
MHLEVKRKNPLSLELQLFIKQIYCLPVDEQQETGQLQTGQQCRDDHDCRRFMQCPVRLVFPVQLAHTVIPYAYCRKETK